MSEPCTDAGAHDVIIDRGTAGARAPLRRGRAGRRRCLCCSPGRWGVRSLSRRSPTLPGTHGLIEFRESAVELVDPVTGQRSQAASAPPSDAAWPPDGRRLAVTRPRLWPTSAFDRDELIVVSPDGTDERVIFSDASTELSLIPSSWSRTAGRSRSGRSAPSATRLESWGRTAAAPAGWSAIPPSTRGAATGHPTADGSPSRGRPGAASSPATCTLV